MEPIVRCVELDPAKVPADLRYPFNIPAISGMGRLEFNAGVTVFMGENGSGKSTLIEAIAIKAGFNPEGGSKHFTTRLRPSESDLVDALRLTRGTRREKSGFFLRAETMFNVATEAEQYREYGWADLHEMSHGEAFFWLAQNRFRAGGLYMLDEPEAALSPQRQLALLVRMHELVTGGSQVLMSTHSPILMAYPGATIYLLNDAGIRRIAYEDTEHYTITLSFLRDRDRMLRMLFEE